MFARLIKLEANYNNLFAKKQLKVVNYLFDLRASWDFSYEFFFFFWLNLKSIMLKSRFLLLLLLSSEGFE